MAVRLVIHALLPLPVVVVVVEEEEEEEIQKKKKKKRNHQHMYKAHALGENHVCELNKENNLKVIHVQSCS
jgi:hypothetical protein